MNPRYFLPVLLFTLCACGFHLRGTQVASSKAGISAIAVRSLSAPLVAAEVSSLFRLGGSDIVATPDRTVTVLTLANEAFDREVLSVSADTGKVKEYQLTLHVSMSVSGPGGKPLVENEIIAVSRDYTFDESSILGKSNEETSLRDDLVRQVSSQIIRRVNAVTK